MTVVTSGRQFLDALATADDIEIDGSLSGMPAIALRPGKRLRGGTLRFGAKGIQLTPDNQLEDVTVIVPDTEVAIGASAADLGRARLRNVRTRGQVLLTPGRGHVEVERPWRGEGDRAGAERGDSVMSVDPGLGAHAVGSAGDAVVRFVPGEGS